jgi:hypothetical protein
MDALDVVLGSGRDLLGRVDATLTAAGAPADSRLWELLRRVGALPGDALEFAAGLDPAPMRAAAEDLRARAVEFTDERSAVERVVADRPWEGSSAGAFGAVWRALADHIGDTVDAGEPTLAGRLSALASFVDGVATWAVTLRGRLAMAVADALASAEAVVLKTAPTDSTAAADAAAAVGVKVLGPLADAVRSGRDLHDAWTPNLAELTYRGADSPGPRGFSTTTRVDL